MTGVTDGANGSVTFLADGTVTYTPNTDFNGSDSFTYTVTTAAGDTETATVNVTINAVADVNDDTLTTNEDTAGTINVLTNDTFGAGAAVTSGDPGRQRIGGFPRRRHRHLHPEYGLQWNRLIYLHGDHGGR